MTTSINHKRRTAFQWTQIIKVSLPLILILVSGFYLRCESGLKTEVIKPLCADAAQYFMYAYNLRHKHTYSHQVGNPKDLDSPVNPDAVRSPGYPLFLTLFVDGLPNKRMIGWILFSQVIISTLTILVAFLFSRGFLSSFWSLAVALLVALSPHQQFPLMALPNLFFSFCKK